MADDPCATAATVWCANPDHNRKTRAMFRVTYLSGRFNPTTACRPCARWVILDQAPEGWRRHVGGDSRCLTQQQPPADRA